MRWCCGGSYSDGATSTTTTNAVAPPTPLLTVSANHQQSQRFGPMHVRMHKTAVIVSEASGESVLLDSLRTAGWNCTIVTPNQALSEIESICPLVILIDIRIPHPCQLAKDISSVTTEEVLVGSIADKHISEKRRRALAQANIIHHVTWNSRDVGLFSYVGRLANRIRALPALFAVLDETDQAIEVCDEQRVVQYVNRAYETVTGCIRSEVIGQPESEMRRKSLPRPRGDEHERRRSSDWKFLRVPFANNTQFVYMKRSNTTTDAAIFRDVSLKSLKSQTGALEAPISEVLSMLRDVSSRIDGDVAQTVKDAMKVLSSTELYAPSINRFRDADRIATQYYDGLIRLHHPARQRKRSVVDAHREKRDIIGSHGERRRVSADVKNALENDNSWKFDILHLEKVSDHHALSQIGMKVFERWKVSDVLGCSDELLNRWILSIEAHYHAGNTYHNATHAADVLQATSFFLDSSSVACHVNESHAVAALLAAAVHDLDHPGRGNAYLINTRQSLAVLYNDNSILENHHIALAFQLTLQHNANVNIFGNLSREEFIQMRHAMIEMVLATDISRHFEYLAKFNKMHITDVAEEQRDTNSLTICDMLVKCADISNPTREWVLCQRWAHRIVEEYFEQTREEKEKGLPVTMEVFDRNTCNVPITQCGFIDMFAREAFATFTEFAKLPELSEQLESNYDRWKQMTTQWTPAHNSNLIL
ncbi:unnamed protein product [Caenorhabditis angaria]|uniref:Phosphodiesterase n=1 Tax=Caenorhabditis angaria TaxID=860376 RepID=A0A9P1I5P6_9PELO|nr:unnamed protein product [Caenorhabditis angaria]